MVRSNTAVKAFIVDNNNLLIIKRSSNDNFNPNIWEIPGGRINIGENPLLGLKREVKEETGINIEIIKILNTENFTNNKKEKIFMKTYLCKPLINNNNKNINNIILSKEHSEYKWISINTLKKELSLLFHETIDKYNKLITN
jgi:8-oxo-dGTP diphosphatase